MRLIFFPRYTSTGPSSRYRFYQYFPMFKEFEINVYPFFDNRYKPGMNFKSLSGLIYTFKCFINRFIKILKLLNRKHICVIQYEFTPYLPFNKLFFKIFKIKYIVDYDDAVFHEYDQSKNKIVRYLLKNKIPNVIKYADKVITGSSYLTDFAKQYNSNVIEIPTSINIEKYKKVYLKYKVNIFTIGWIGSLTTSKNLIQLIPVFKRLREEKITFQINCIGFNNDLLDKFEGLPFNSIQWNDETEVEEIKKFDIGIMPLEDDLFNKGKCAFKLIQYMACGIPTISSPFSSNLNVDRNKENLFASTDEEWANCIIKMINNKDKYLRIGQNNIKIAEKYYSVQSNYKKYINCFNSVNN